MSDKNKEEILAGQTGEEKPRVFNAHNLNVPDIDLLVTPDDKGKVVVSLPRLPETGNPDDIPLRRLTNQHAQELLVKAQNTITTRMPSVSISDISVQNATANVSAEGNVVAAKVTGQASATASFTISVNSLNPEVEKKMQQDFDEQRMALYKDWSGSRINQGGATLDITTDNDEKDKTTRLLKISPEVHRQFLAEHTVSTPGTPNTAGNGLVENVINRGLQVIEELNRGKSGEKSSVKSETPTEPQAVTQKPGDSNPFANSAHPSNKLYAEALDFVGKHQGDLKFTGAPQDVAATVVGRALSSGIDTEKPVTLIAGKDGQVLGYPAAKDPSDPATPRFVVKDSDVVPNAYETIGRELQQKSVTRETPPAQIEVQPTQDQSPTIAGRSR
jgi:hypothetical protein